MGEMWRARRRAGFGGAMAGTHSQGPTPVHVHAESAAAVVEMRQELDARSVLVVVAPTRRSSISSSAQSTVNGQRVPLAGRKRYRPPADDGLASSSSPPAKTKNAVPRRQILARAPPQPRGRMTAAESKPSTAAAPCSPNADVAAVVVAPKAQPESRSRCVDGCVVAVAAAVHTTLRPREKRHANFRVVPVGV